MHEQERSSWVYGISIGVIILFGTFWYYERSRDSEAQRIPPNMTSLHITPSPHEPDLGELQAAAINTAIPNFSDQF